MLCHVLSFLNVLLVNFISVYDSPLPVIFPYYWVIFWGGTLVFACAALLFFSG